MRFKVKYQYAFSLDVNFNQHQRYYSVGRAPLYLNYLFLCFHDQIAEKKMLKKLAAVLRKNSVIFTEYFVDFTKPFVEQRHVSVIFQQRCYNMFSFYSQ